MIFKVFVMFYLQLVSKWEQIPGPPRVPSTLTSFLLLLPQKAVDWVLFLRVGCISRMVLVDKGRLRHMLPLTSCCCGTHDCSHSGWRKQIRKHVTPNLTIVWSSLTVLILSPSLGHVLFQTI